MTLNPQENPERSSFLQALMDRLLHNPGAEIIRFARGRENLISLASGQTDSSTPDFVVAAMNAAIARGETGYSPVLGQPALRQALADYYRRIYAIDLPTDRVIVTPSGTTAIHVALQAAVQPGDRAVVVTPLWRTLTGALGLQRAEIIEFPLTNSPDGWRLDVDRLLETLTPATKVLMINSPNNPTGWVIGRDEIKTLLDHCRQHGIWIIADEVYDRWVYGVQAAQSFLHFATAQDKLFVINSFSKNWAMTGWRLGWLVAPQGMEKTLSDLVTYDYMGPNSFTQLGAIAALTQGEEFLAAEKRVSLANRDYVYQRLQGMGIETGPLPPSTFYGFFRIPDQTDCFAFAKRLIEEGGLALAPGCSFGQHMGGYMRLCFGAKPEKMVQALDRLEKIIKKA